MTKTSDAIISFPLAFMRAKHISTNEITFQSGDYLVNNPFRRLVCRLIMPAAEGLSEK